MSYIRKYTIFIYYITKCIYMYTYMRAYTHVCNVRKNLVPECIQYHAEIDTVSMLIEMYTNACKNKRR